jgi:hypothetical protein
MTEANPYVVRYGNSQGELQLGHLFDDKLLSAAMLRNTNKENHYIVLDHEGPREGWIRNRCPGTYAIRCGDKVKKDDWGFVTHCLNGDIVIKADTGKIILEAVDIQLKATGGSNDTGNITINAPNNLNLTSGKNINGTSSAAISFISSGFCKIQGKSDLELSGSNVEVIESSGSVANGYIPGMTKSAEEAGLGVLPQ